MNTRRVWMFGLVFLVLLSGSVSGCKSIPNTSTSAEIKLLDDTLFPLHHAFAVESPEEIFHLEEDALLFAEHAVNQKGAFKKDIKKFVKAIFEHSDKGMRYRNSANTAANVTFNNRAANCLSLSIMTYALAEHAGLHAKFFEVDIPEYWTRREGYSLLNGHINLRVSLPSDYKSSVIGEKWADVDFDPQTLRNLFPRVAVSKEKVIAMFYNNKGADAILANSYTKAYSYFRAAAKIAPDLQQSWANLGVLYRMVGAYEQAENVYKYTLSVDDDNLTAWENLSILYRYQGKTEEAVRISEMVERKRLDNPFYHYILGEQALEQGHIAFAVEHFKAGLKLDDKNHEILFALARAYFLQKDVSRAQSYIRKAARHSDNEQDRLRYTAKLSNLQSNTNPHR